MIHGQALGASAGASDARPDGEWKAITIVKFAYVICHLEQIHDTIGILYRESVQFCIDHEG